MYLSVNGSRVRSRSPSPPSAWVTPSGSPLRGGSGSGATNGLRQLFSDSETTIAKTARGGSGKSSSSSKSKADEKPAPPETSAENILTDDAQINADVEYIRTLFPQYHIDDIRIKLFEHYDHKHRIEVRHLHIIVT